MAAIRVVDNDSDDGTLEIVQRHAMRAWRERRPFLELLAADPQVSDRLGASGLKECFDPAWFLRHVDTIFTRAGLR